MNFLKATGHSVRFASKRGLINNFKPSSFNQKATRLYSTSNAQGHKEGSNIPWAIGSFVVFGPILFKLTSPPPSKKKTVDDHTPANVQVIAATPVVAADKKEEQEQEQVAAPVKKAQKPYVLVGAGTASFAAAQAIKEKDPEANVSCSCLKYKECDVDCLIR